MDSAQMKWVVVGFSFNIDSVNDISSPDNANLVMSRLGYTIMKMLVNLKM